MEADLALIALLVAGYALVASRLNRWSVGASLVFLLIGIVLSDDVLGRISLEPEAEPVKLLAEVTLTLLLFVDASTVRAGALRRDASTVARLLIVGLLLTMVVGTGAALLLFPGISLGIALLIGTTLAPTDAALGQPVVTNPTVPARVRRVLNVESGLNDGIATPFVFFALALATSEGTGEGGWLAGALTDTRHRDHGRAGHRARRRDPAAVRRWPGMDVDGVAHAGPLGAGGGVLPHGRRRRWQRVHRRVRRRARLRVGHAAARRGDPSTSPRPLARFSRSASGSRSGSRWPARS